MIRMGYRQRQRDHTLFIKHSNSSESWMFGYLSTAHFAISLNGTPKGFFLATRGLTQGDSLSPFLFILAVDSLSEILKIAENNGLLKGFQVGKPKSSTYNLLMTC